MVIGISLEIYEFIIDWFAAALEVTGVFLYTLFSYFFNNKLLCPKFTSLDIFNVNFFEYIH